MGVFISFYFILLFSFLDGLVFLEGVCEKRN